jgi:hypothetical protein
VTGEAHKARNGVVMLGLLGCGAHAAACATAGVPDPRSQVHAYAAAVSTGDAHALYAMMTDESRRARSADEVAGAMASERPELVEQAAGLERSDARVDATVTLRFADGEEAALELRHGRYGVLAAGALPGGGRTPAEILDQLRRVLARRSYVGLMRVLAATTRATVETDLRSLVDGLAVPEALQIQMDGDSAAVSVPGGHKIKLKREQGIWRVEDFD